MAEWRGVEFRDGKPLRCELCGEQIGLYFGEKPDLDVVVARCYACAAAEAAEAITAEAVADVEHE